MDLRDHPIDPIQLSDAASALLTETAADRFGMVSPSIYESARLVSLAPWLHGHLDRIGFLLDSRHPAGHWGGYGAYGIIPTLSATEALLKAARDREMRLGDTGHERVLAAADRGLDLLFAWFGGGKGPAVPDTVAVELLIPALVTDINDHLDELAREPIAGPGAWRTSRRLVLPRDLSHRPLLRLRELAREGGRLPEKLWHSLEIAGPAIAGTPFVRPVHGAVGCSPAATAAWLGSRTPPTSAQASVRYLVDVQHPGGAVPVGAPVDLFERAWLLSQFAAAGLPVRLPSGLLEQMHDVFGESGASVGAGLLPDADDTATALYALAMSGSPHPPDSLWGYRVNAHFACFPAERTASTSANAHVLQALGVNARQGIRFEKAIDELAGWLRDHQHGDGYWTDKWHASPYYGTACCVCALAEFDAGNSTEAIGKAVKWIMETQRADGSWGRWLGTYEETAYAIQVLLRARTGTGDHLEQVMRGCRFLRAWGNREHPALWHDKDLYAPTRVIRAAGLAALHLAGTRIASPAVAGDPG